MQLRQKRGKMSKSNNHTNTELSILTHIGIGTNLGDRQANIETTLQKLGATPNIDVVHVSSVYETDPIGFTEQPDFLNLVAALRTTLPPRDLLGVLLHIEMGMGRVRTERWGPRVIDLDLLLYGKEQIELPGLTVPHPRLRERAFVLAPLAEIAPDLTLPGDGKKVRELIENFSEPGNIRRLGGVSQSH